MFNFEKKCFAVVTGASKGIGRTIALELAERAKSLIIILIARSEKGLLETKSNIEKLNSNAKVTIYPIDLASETIETYEEILRKHYCDVENAIIFHNAGSTGTVDYVINLTNRSIWEQFFALNVISPTLLNAAFLKIFKPSTSNIFVINISSLCGSKPFKNLGMYGSAKAARDLLFKVLAAEDLDVMVLNYCPGPVNTDMVTGIIDTVQDSEIKNMFVTLKAEETILKPEVTVTKMMNILKNGDYKSGDLIDYYDKP